MTAAEWKDCLEDNLDKLKDFSKGQWQAIKVGNWSKTLLGKIPADKIKDLTEKQIKSIDWKKVSAWVKDQCRFRATQKLNPMARECDTHRVLARTRSLLRSSPRA